jgi:hypothetical protein
VSAFGADVHYSSWEPEPEKRLILTESVMTHMLADLDQIVTEHAMDPAQKTDEQWWAMLRHAVDGEDYKTNVI